MIDIYYEAQWKLQNCLRITTDVDNFKTEVHNGEAWVPVAQYVEGLVKYIREGGEL